MRPVTRLLAFSAFAAVSFACSDRTPVGPHAGPVADHHASSAGGDTAASGSNGSTSGGTQSGGDSAHTGGADTTVSGGPIPTPPPSDTQATTPRPVPEFRTVQGSVVGWAGGDTTVTEGPVAGAAVVITTVPAAGGAPAKLGAATTDLMGRFSISGVPEGAIDVTITPPAGSPYLGTVSHLSAVNVGDLDYVIYLKHR